MNIQELVKKKSEWLKGTGPESNIVISSRVRLARNFQGYVFLNRAKPEDKEVILEKSRELIESYKLTKKINFIKMANLSEMDRLVLVERHLMSPEHMKSPQYKALAFDDREIVSIMICEEDHLRTQVLQSGFNLTQAWTIIDEIDNEFSQKEAFAFSPQLGYLTACPTNTGTGLRGSVMIHLPALSLTNQVGKIYQAISKLGLTMRGFYGEGTEASGDFYQISNQVTLGRTEVDLLENIEKIVKKIITRESATRNMLLSKNKSELQDKVWRAYGILNSARIISSKEALTRLSIIRLGIDLGIVNNIGMEAVNDLFIFTQPAHLQKIEGKLLTAQERDAKRAALIREKLK